MNGRANPLARPRVAALALMPLCACMWPDPSGPLPPAQDAAILGKDPPLVPRPDGGAAPDSATPPTPTASCDAGTATGDACVPASDADGALPPAQDHDAAILGEDPPEPPVPDGDIPDSGIPDSGMVPGTATPPAPTPSCDPVTAALPDLTFCRTCHIPGGLGDVPTFRLTPSSADDFDSLVASWKQIGDEMLLIPAEVGGRVHQGGSGLIPQGSASYDRFAAWIDAVEQYAECSGTP